MMKAAASLSNLSCNFVDLLSPGGKDTSETPNTGCVSYCDPAKDTTVCVSVCVVSRGTWREDARVEAHLKDDVAD